MPRMTNHPSVMDKVLAILDSFSASDDSLSLAELVQRTGMPKSTLHRVATTLLEGGLLDRVDNRYQLGIRLHHLGLRVHAVTLVRELSLPYMEDVHRLTGQTIHLGVASGTDVVYVQKVGGHRQLFAPSRLGGHMPMYCTAIGKALLAFSDETVRRSVLTGHLERRTPRTHTTSVFLERELALAVASGVAFEQEESCLGVACVASPIRDGRGRAVAAMSISGRPPAFVPQRHASLVRQTADEIERLLASQQQRTTPQPLVGPAKAQWGLPAS